MCVPKEEILVYYLKVLHVSKGERSIFSIKFYACIKGGDKKTHHPYSILDWDSPPWVVLMVVW
jgi:hypothetical protein